MADPNPAAPPAYPNVPPAPPPGVYPPQGYPWPASASVPYRGPMLPAWLTFGTVLVLVGGVLVLIGFLVSLIANATATSGAANAVQTYYNEMAVFDALVGVGIFLVVLGWLFHQMSVHRRSGH
ncbi:MAG: hypothetical protein ACREDE_02465 [Thermoplasmata archaeon]